MSRTDGLFDISRRKFCGLAGAGAVGVAIAACTNGEQAIETGPLGGGNPGDIDAPLAPNPDAHPQGNPDAGVGSPDAPTGVACSGSPIDVGPASSYTLNSPKYFSSGRFFVVKDSGGFYAMTALCTHEGAITCVGTSNSCSTSGTKIFCPRHGALFTFNGAIISGPVVTPLKHYAMCNTPGGNLGVMTTQIATASARISG